jgi:hypothetical protein
MATATAQERISALLQRLFLAAEEIDDCGSFFGEIAIDTTVDKATRKLCRRLMRACENANAGRALDMLNAAGIDETTAVEFPQDTPGAIAQD